MNPLPLCYRIQQKLPIFVEEIAYLEGCGNYTTIHFIDGNRIMLSKNIGLLGSLLSPTEFIRLNKTYLVHLKSIVAYQYAVPKWLAVQLPNGQWTEVSRRRIKEVKQKISASN